MPQYTRQELKKIETDKKFAKMREEHEKYKEEQKLKRKPMKSNKKSGIKVGYKAW